MTPEETIQGLMIEIDHKKSVINRLKTENEVLYKLVGLYLVDDKNKLENV